MRISHIHTTLVNLFNFEESHLTSAFFWLLQSSLTTRIHTKTFDRNIMVGANTSSISTQYYKLAHLGSISYTIYTSSDNNDQALLELELTIRHKWPQILVTYYNKSLYYFVFGHNKVDSETIDLTKEFPQLSTKYTDTVNVDQFPNPHKSTKMTITWRG